MAPPKGSTNNPHGRPAKSRALTDLLVKALDKTIEVEGKKVAGKRVLARLVSEVLVTGRLKFPGDVEASIISVKDWLEFTKWAYGYLEPPVQKTAPTTPDGENPYMGAEAGDLIEIARKIANANNTGD
jgi:hypothetical protein